MVLRELTLFIVISCISIAYIEARSVDGIRSDVIETKYPDPSQTKNVFQQDALTADSDMDDASAKKPGWMVRTYRKLRGYFRRPEAHGELNKNSIESNPENQISDDKRTQLMRFGAITSRVSNSLGGSAMKVASIIEKLCKMLKTVIPIVAAVCNVGQFKFCMSADAPLELGEAMNRPMDLNQQDK